MLISNFYESNKTNFSQEQWVGISLKAGKYTELIAYFDATRMIFLKFGF